MTAVNSGRSSTVTELRSTPLNEEPGLYTLDGVVVGRCDRAMPVESFSNLTPVIQFLTALVGLVLALRGLQKKSSEDTEPSLQALLKEISSYRRNLTPRQLTTE